MQDKQKNNAIESVNYLDEANSELSPKKSKENESGRSMVEMLGVLALMGVLAIGGVAGYRWAMDMYYASTTIKELNERAVVYSHQMLAEQAELSSDEFKPGDKTGLGYALKANIVEGQPFFRIELDSVPKGVCQKIVDADWYVPFSIYVNGAPDYGSGIECPIRENKMVFYFQADLNGDMGEVSASGWRPEESWMFICRNNSYCSQLEPVCDTDTGKCGPCETNNDCADRPSYPVCDVETGACEKCQTNADCAAVPGKPVCLASQGRCVECLTNPDCGNNPKGEICNENNYTCRPCEWDSDCTGQPNGEVCDRDTGLCVECLDNPDCVGNQNGSVCMTEFKTCGQCEARTCSDTTQCGTNEACVDGKCICPNGFWINNCECVSCPEGSTPTMEDNALTCTCPPPYIWESGECRHCIQGKTSQDIMGFGVLERCSKTCPDGYYYSYKEAVPPGSKFTTGDGSCKKINPLDVDKIPDDWLLENYARIKDPAYKENPDLALFAGENPTPDEIRKKLKELLDGYAMPDPTQATPSFEWTNAKSWCEAQGYRMAKASDMRGDSKMQIRAAAFVVGYRGYNFETRCCIWLDSGCNSYSDCDTMMCRGLAIDSEIGAWWGGANAWSYNTICIK